MLQPLNPQDMALGVAQTPQDLCLHYPSLVGAGQFICEFPALQKETDRPWPSKSHGATQQFIQWRQGSRCNDASLEWISGLDARYVNCDRNLCYSSRLPQKRGLPSVRFDQMHFAHAQYRQNETGKTRAATEVHKIRRGRRNVPMKLGRIEDVATPDFAETRGAHKIDPVIPAR
jgi:hypothetical protein